MSPAQPQQQLQQQRVGAIEACPDPQHPAAAAGRTCSNVPALSQLPSSTSPPALTLRARPQAKATAAAAGKKRRVTSSPETESLQRDCCAKAHDDDEEEEELSGCRGAKGGEAGAGHASHSSVEKRRRDRINALIEELAEYVPPPPNKYSIGGPAGGARRPKHTILSDTLTLLSDMRKAIDARERRIAELVAEAAALRAAVRRGADASAGAVGAASTGGGSPASGAEAAVKEETANPCLAAPAHPHVPLLQHVVLDGSGNELRSCTSTVSWASGPAAPSGGDSVSERSACLGMFLYDACDPEAEPAEAEPAKAAPPPALPGGAHLDLLTLMPDAGTLLLPPGGLCALGLGQLEAAESQLDALSGAGGRCPMLLAPDEQAQNNGLDWLDWMVLAQMAGSDCQVAAR